MYLLTCFFNFFIILIAFILLQRHCVWAAAEAYSAPSIVLTSRSQDGMHVFDDFREAYSWLSHNTDNEDKVSDLILWTIDLSTK